MASDSEMYQSLRELQLHNEQQESEITRRARAAANAAIKTKKELKRLLNVLEDEHFSGTLTATFEHGQIRTVAQD